MTLEERGALEKFKDILDEHDIDYETDYCDDMTLIRFLRARKLDMVKSLEMFQNFLKWREEQNIDDIAVNNKITIL